MPNACIGPFGNCLYVVISSKHSTDVFTQTAIALLIKLPCLFCCFKRIVFCLISTQPFTSIVLYLFSNERRIKALKNEYESNLPEGDASKNGVLLEEVKEKHSKELAEIKVC